MSSLQERLDRITADFGAKVPAEVKETMGRATEELRASGILERIPSPGSPLPAFALPDTEGRPPPQEGPAPSESGSEPRHRGVDRVLEVDAGPDGPRVRTGEEPPAPGFLVSWARGLFAAPPEALLGAAPLEEGASWERSAADAVGALLGPGSPEAFWADEVRVGEGTAELEVTAVDEAAATVRVTLEAPLESTEALPSGVSFERFDARVTLDGELRVDPERRAVLALDCEADVHRLRDYSSGAPPDATKDEEVHVERELRARPE